MMLAIADVIDDMYAMIHQLTRVLDAARDHNYTDARETSGAAHALLKRLDDFDAFMIERGGGIAKTDRGIFLKTRRGNTVIIRPVVYPDDESAQVVSFLSGEAVAYGIYIPDEHNDTESHVADMGSVESAIEYVRYNY
jgi:hypothetical protein